MLLVMGVSLFTVRIVLKVLGVEDYGIYNVVAGIVSMFGFLSGTMASASQRFFAFEIGKKDFVKLKQTFSMTVTIYAMLAILIIILAETVGLWFLNNKMTIPPDRMEAAHWVYHFAIASFVVTIMAIPYNAAIIAKENMKVFAYISILEVILKLAIVYMLMLFDADKLKLYAVLMFIATLIIRFAYSLYCRRAYTEFKYSFYWDRELFKALIGYSGWNMIGVIANIIKNQGIDVLLNIFFNPILNAARAIAFQIFNALNQLTINVYSATRPQITKLFAKNDIEQMWKLVFQSLKISYFLLLIISIPIIINPEIILSIWLHKFPSQAIIYVRLILISFLIETSVNQLIAVMQSANKIKHYQIFASVILLLNLPISFFLLKMGYNEFTPFIVIVILSCFYIGMIIYISYKYLRMSLKNFFIHVHVKLYIVSLFSFACSFLLKQIFDNSLLHFIYFCLISFTFSIIIIFYFGFNKSEKQSIILFLKNKILKQ